MDFKQNSGVQFISPSESSRMECESWFRPILDAVNPGWIAGGCLRDYFSRTPCTSDVDVFFSSADDLAKAQAAIKGTDATELYDTPTTAGYEFRGNHIQMVKQRFYQSVEATISEFDFTVCCCGIDSNGRVVMHRQFFEDLAAKRLLLNGTPCPVATLGRIVRYVKKGFSIDRPVLLELALAIQSATPVNRESNVLEFYTNGRRRHGRLNDS